MQDSLRKLCSSLRTLRETDLPSPRLHETDLPSPTLHKFKKASLFDLDHTLLKKNSSYVFGSHLYSQKYMTFTSMLYYVALYAFHKAGAISIEGMHTSIFRGLFKGLSYQEIYDQASIFLERQFEGLLYHPAVARLHQAQLDGHYTAIFSSSPDFLVSILAKKFKVNSWIGTGYKVDNEGRFCHISGVVEGNVKMQVLQDMSMRIGISVTDVTAYSDSHLDLPFLKAAGNAIGVNPDVRLKKECLTRNWEII